MGPIAALPAPESRNPLRPAVPHGSDEKHTSLIESEIVIVDEYGNETPFDPELGFE